MCCCCCIDVIDKEFRVEKICFEHEYPSEFLTPQWPFNQKVYVFYRLFIAAGFICWLIADIVYETRAFFKDHTYNYLIYATNWSFMLLTLTALCMASCTLFYYVRSDGCLDDRMFERMPTSLKVQWLLQNLSYNSAIVVSVSYWSYIAVLDKSVVLQTPSSQVKHTLNTIYVVIDMLFSGSPIRILHFLYTVCLGSIYAVFNAIYFLNDGTILEGRHYAYNLLDWGKPSEAITTSVLCVVLCIFGQIILYEVYRIRRCIYTKAYFGSDGMVNSDSEMRRIMGETETPAYQTIQDRGQDNTVNQIEEKTETIVNEIN